MTTGHPTRYSESLSSLSLFNPEEIRMRSFLRWLGIGLGSLVGLVLLAGLGATIKANVQLNKTYSI